MSAFEVLFTVFAVGTFWFWLALATLCSIVIVTVENEQVLWSTGITLATVWALCFFNHVHPFDWIYAHPLLTVLLVTGYFVIGVLWSIGKWWFFVQKRRVAYDKYRTGFVKQHDLSPNEPIPAKLKTRFLEGVGASGSDSRDFSIGPPSASRHKERILIWMTYWPWSMTWTLVNDPVRKIFAQMFTHLQAVYMRIAEGSFRDAKRDLIEEPAPPKDKVTPS